MNVNAPKPNPTALDLREPAAVPVRLTEFSRYVDAQQAVDTLSDRAFPMSGVSIVWAGLRHVEHVTGRRTIATAARDGAMSGAWFGLILGLLFSAFADASTSIVGMVLTYALVGAATVAAFQAFQHWARRGTRDFSTVGQLDAERYELWVEPAHLATAQQILGLSSQPTEPTSIDS